MKQSRRPRVGMTSLPVSVPLLLVIALGPIVSFGFEAMPIAGIVLWAATTLVGLALALRLPRLDARSLWIWIVLGLFAVGYFGKTFYAATWLDGHGDLSDLNPEWGAFSDADLLRSYEVVSAAFLVFAAGLLFTARPTALDEAPPYRRSRVRSAIAGIAVVVLALTLLRGALGIGVMGLETEGLPFGIDTIIFRAQSSLIPALLLVLMWAGERNEDTLSSALAILVLGLHLVAIAAVSASKAGLIHFAAYVLFLWIVSNRLTPKRELLLALIGVAAIGFYVVGAEFRVLRVDGLSFSEALETVWSVEDAPFADLSNEGLRAIFLRISGAEGTWFVLSDLAGSAASMIDRLAAVWSTSIRDVYTRQIVGVTWLQDFRAPGFIGALLLVFGLAGVGLCLLIGPLVSFAWRLVGHFPAAPAQLAFSAVFLLQTLMEGIFQWQDLAVFALTLPVAAVFAGWLAGAGLPAAARDALGRTGRPGGRFRLSGP